MDFTLIAALLVAVPPAETRAEVRDPAVERSEGVIVLQRCLVDHERSSAVGPALPGILKECLVQPGDEVEEGQIIGRLEDEDARAEVQLRETEASSRIDIRLCESKNALAQNRLRITTLLVQRNAASREEFSQQRLEAEATALEVENARHRRELAEAQLRHARAMLRAREFVSPHSGIVTEVLKRPSEPVAPNLPVFRITDVDHLLVIGQVDVVDVWRLHAGQPVRVIPEIAGADLALEHEVFAGRIFFIDPRVDPLSQTCKVLARCENRDRLLRAGLEVRLEIPTGGPATPAPPVGG